MPDEAPVTAAKGRMSAFKMLLLIRMGARLRHGPRRDRRRGDRDATPVDTEPGAPPRQLVAARLRKRLARAFMILGGRLHPPLPRYVVTGVPQAPRAARKTGRGAIGMFRNRHVQQRLSTGGGSWAARRFSFERKPTLGLVRKAGVIAWPPNRLRMAERRCGATGTPGTPDDVHVARRAGAADRAIGRSAGRPRQNAPSSRPLGRIPAFFT